MNMLVGGIYVACTPLSYIHILSSLCLYFVVIVKAKLSHFISLEKVSFLCATCATLL